LPNRKKSFGKLSSDIKLEGDATISSLHAIVSVESTEELDVNLFLSYSVLYISCKTLIIFLTRFLSYKTVIFLSRLLYSFQMQYKCVINDVSKYGTFLTRDNKKIKLSKNENFFLKTGDIVQFGLKETTFV